MAIYRRCSQEMQWAVDHFGGSKFPSPTSGHNCENNVLAGDPKFHISHSDAWPWEKKGILFWLVEFEGEPSQKAVEERAESTRRLGSHSVGQGLKLSAPARAFGRAAISPNMDAAQ